MKRYLIILVIVYIKSYGQLSPTKNYISVIKPKSPILTSQVTANNYPKEQEVKYFDGLGRNIQNIILGVTPSGKDLIYPIDYDNRGLKSKEYLPYPSVANNNGAYSNSATSYSNSFYSTEFPTETTNYGPTSFMNAFSEKVIENSPLQRTIEISAPGKDWKASGYDNIYMYPSYDFSWSSSEFVTGTVAGGSPVTFKVDTSGLLKIVFNFGGPNLKFNLGDVKFIGYIPDVDLGYIKSGGVNTSYFVRIKNGYLNISSTNNESLQSISTIFTYQFIKKNTRLNSSNSNTIKIENGINKTDQIIRYDVELDSDRNPKLINNNFYDESKLFKTVVRDENWKPKQYHVEWNCGDFSYLNNAVTGSNIILDINNGVLSLTININSNPWSVIRVGAVKALPIEINDINLGNLVDVNTNIPIYNVYIQKNNLCIKRIYTGTLTQAVKFNTVLTSNLVYYNNLNDPSGNIEFRDLNDRLILKRNSNGDQAHDTQYVYDIYGNLTYVIPPAATDLLSNAIKNISPDITATNTITSGNTINLAASNSIKLLPGFHAQMGSNFTASINAGTSDILNDLCYQYKYDINNHLVEKKLPGKDWEYIVYDLLSRPILIQDANLRASNKWLFTKYDVFNRPVYTGFYTNTTVITRAAMQSLAKTNSVMHEKKQNTITVINGTSQYYSNLAFPTDGIDLLTLNYYDNYYMFDLAGGVSESSYTITPAITVKGLVTATKVRVLDTNKWITNVNYYDNKERIIYAYSNNDYLSTIDKVKYKLDFVGKTLENTKNHTRATITTSIIDTFTYDNAGRLLTQKQKINNQTEETIVSNTYNELGQLITKGVGGKITQNRLQTIDYKYNIRGWLKNINDPNLIGSDLFAFQINYNDPTSAATALYNGNISQTFWKTKNTDSGLKNYNYSYDPLNRLTQGVDNLNRYSEYLTYDKNGNITLLKRNGNTDTNANVFGEMDNLTYSYFGNKIIKVEDSAGNEGFKNGSNIPIEYTYDANGNMKTDSNKGITSITYNHLNLPTQITIAGGTINYVYDANGVKLKKTINSTSPTEYVSGFQYDNSVLKFFSTTEGYANNNSGTFIYIYQYKDHLGNIRLSYGDNNNDGAVANSEIVEESNYYPFGLKQKVAGEIIFNSIYKYKYNGKELQDELGLNFYDYGARNYDPALGRWMNIDPLAEKSRRFNPYTYALNNPIRFIDPDGMQANDIIFRGTDKKEVRVVTPGEDVVVNLPFSVGTNKTIDIGAGNINSGRFVYGYTVQGDAGGGVGLVGQWGGEVSVANFTDNKYGNYNYVYAGGHINKMIGAQMGISAGIGGSLFVGYNDSKDPISPTSFEGNTYSVNISADLKALVGGGISISGFSSVENPVRDKGWKGISVGIGVGVGVSENAGSVGFQTSSTMLLNDVKPTSQRGFLDRMANSKYPIPSSVLQATANKLLN
jgi:RHS repeat-associated protein